ADFANGGAAVDVNAADFAGTQTHLGVHAFTGQQHGRCAGRTGQLRALARRHLDAVDRGADGNVANGQRVAGTDGSIFTRKQRSTDLEAARSDDVTTLAVG